MDTDAMYKERSDDIFTTFGVRATLRDVERCEPPVVFQ
jgi:hypothetical protein